MKKKVKSGTIKNEEHDPKTCFRCRLHDLFEELRSHNDAQFMLMALAEASGSMLSQFEDEAKIAFMLMVTKTCREDEDDEVSQAKRATKH